VSENKAAVLAGWYVDVSYLKKAGIARIQVEIPMDIWESHQGVLGIPPAFDAAKKFVALTRLTESAFKAWAAEQSSSGLSRDTENGPGESALAADRRYTIAEAQGQDKPRTYTRSQIAAMKCRDPAFARWLMDCHRMDWLLALELPGIDTDEDRADYCIKAALGIQSKSELDAPAPNPKADAWDRLEASFRHRDQVRT